MLEGPRFPPDALHRLIGEEQPIGAVASGLAAYCRVARPAHVGAYQVCCSDESETENVAAFHREVVRALLPELGNFTRSSFRTANLGARYEVGAIPVAEDHFALPDMREGGFKMLIIKLNTHCGVVEERGVRRYGSFERYGRDSLACGALAALMAGSELPFAQELRATFQRGDIDRLGFLKDAAPEERALLAAVSAARLQAERLLGDMRRHRPATPTVYTIAYGVTLNRRQADTELLCGLMEVDDSEGQSSSPEERIMDVGLGSDPHRYRVTHTGGRLRVTDTSE